MPITPVILTKSLVVFEIASANGTLRLEIDGRKLAVDPETGRIIGGTISSIKTFEYNTDVSTGAGRSWDRIDLPAADLSVLLGTADWHIPQPASLAYYDQMALLPGSTVVSTFTSNANFVAGSTTADYLFGKALGDVIEGRGGNDKLYGGNGLDQLFGGDGNDSLYGGADEDLLQGDAGDDRLVGDAGFNSLYGGDGNDKLSSGNDGSTMDGGAGNDVLIAGAGNDDLRGGTDNDVLVSGAGNDTLLGETGDDQLTGGDGADVMYGGDGIDKMKGGFGADQLEGGLGNDEIEGDEDDDIIYGGDGNDFMNGGAGNDTIHVETGNDTIVGGLGIDSFMFTSETTGAKLIAGFNGLEDEVIFGQFAGDVSSAYQYFLEHAVEVGRSVVFTDGDLSITFNRTSMSAFSLETFGTPSDGEDGGGWGGEVIG
jgi:Ca2+-binding RTX toxin-like protein